MFKTSRNFLILAVATLTIGACQTQTKTEQIAGLKTTNDSLQLALYERDSLMNDMMETFEQIENDLAFIKEQRNIIAVNSDNAENQLSKKEQVIQDVQELAQLLQESKKRLDKLNRKLKESGVKIASLEKQVEELAASLETRNAEMLALTQELEKKNYEVGVLTEQLVALETLNTQQDNVIKEQTAAIDAYNLAYYTLGTAKELKEQGIITKQGGFLGLGRIKTLNTGANKSYFSEFDLRQTTEIQIDAEEVHLLSEHPSGSYEFVEANEKIASLNIKDPAEFYRFTKYIVLEIE